MAVRRQKWFVATWDLDEEAFTEKPNVVPVIVVHCITSVVAHECVGRNAWHRDARDETATAKTVELVRQPIAACTDKAILADNLDALIECMQIHESTEAIAEHDIVSSVIAHK